MLMADVDYHAWADYLAHLLQKYSVPGKRVLDLGCGTGSITVPLAKKGYTLTGVDLSPEMLSLAAKKAEEAGCANIQWHEMDITEPDLEWDSYDAIIATFDVINHLTEEADVQLVFQEAGMMLTDNGLFVFDIQTPYRLREIQGNQTYAFHSDAVEYMWENHFDEETEICYMDLTFFCKEDDGRYHRLIEHQEERSYEPELLRMWLEISGFEVLGIFGELTEEELQDDDLRAVIVARRKSFDEDFEDDWSEVDEDSVF